LKTYFYLGPIAIDQVDPQGNFIVIENAGSTGKDQDMKGWTLRRKIDSKDDIVYKFPDNFVLKSRSRLRILSRNASKGLINEKETLVAEGVQTWGTGTNMVTRLLDANEMKKPYSIRNSNKKTKFNHSRRRSRKHRLILSLVPFIKLEMKNSFTFVCCSF